MQAIGFRTCFIRPLGARHVSVRMTAFGAIRCAGCHPRAAKVRVTAVGAAAGPTAANDEYLEKRYKAEFHMMYSRLGGVVQQAVAAAVLRARDKADSRTASQEINIAEEEAVSQRHHGVPVAPSTWKSTPAGMASAFLRCLDAQLQAKKFMSGGDEAGDVLGSFPSASLFYYPGGGLQKVVEHLATAASEVRGAAAPAAAAVVRSLAGAVARMASQPNAEAAQGKAAAVMTCLDGMAEALEGAAKGVTTSMGPGAPSAAAASSLSAADLESAAMVVHLEAGQLLREVAAVLDCIAGGSPDLPAIHNEGGRMLSPSTPAHPLLSALETRLYADSTWRSDSAAEIASGLVDFLAALLAPSCVGNTSAAASAVARGSACAALHSLAQAQNGLAVVMRKHRAEPAVVSRLLAALAEALAAACITRDAAYPDRGPSPLAMFGEAQVLVGMARMAAGEAIAEVVVSVSTMNCYGIIGTKVSPASPVTRASQEPTGVTGVNLLHRSGEYELWGRESGQWSSPQRTSKYA
ncbi:hypothetical protein Vafri_6562 [Volvox africanus]|uniref:Uncharacterized protein n=1 Tax=Volvox africanus TaxID=51714 RepID=A0A8J4AYQ6_9CHLO|nr:hypothetical protein Vafri_6562 [Volvox africanus]